jgi:hypothetical protein
MTCLASALWISKDTFISCLWTAHAVKYIPARACLFHRKNSLDVIMPAMPNYSDLFDPQFISGLADLLFDIDPNLLPNSLCEQRDVCRIPLKPDAINPKEERDLALSLDGLRYVFWFPHHSYRYFRPVAIYGENCQSRAGLITILRRVQLMEGAGKNDTKKYSILQADVSLFQSLVKLLYSFRGMSSLRRDIYLCFGIWHSYLYAHVAVWQAFRFVACFFFPTSIFACQVHFLIRCVLAS